VWSLRPSKLLDATKRIFLSLALSIFVELLLFCYHLGPDGQIEDGLEGRQILALSRGVCFYDSGFDYFLTASVIQIAIAFLIRE
jgi:hypothetical protein